MIDPLRMIDDGLARSGKSAWTRNRGPFDVYRECAVDARFVPGLERPEIGDAGIDEKSVEPAECSTYPFGNDGLRGNIAGIGLNGEDICQFSSDDCKPFGVRAGNGDACALLDETARSSTTDAARGAGYQCDLVGKTGHALLLS